MLFLLLAAATPQTAIDAERAFAADAQALGQWTAFRKWASAEATMFLPQPVNAQAALKDWRDPPRSIAWWPTASYVSCDGKIAVNTGGWRQPDGSVGFFTTVWQRQADGRWRWLVDGGDGLKTPRGTIAVPPVTRAGCGSAPGVVTTPVPYDYPRAKQGAGASADRTLVWEWAVHTDGSRDFAVYLWNGQRFEGALSDHIAAPPPPRPATP